MSKIGLHYEAPPPEERQSSWWCRRLCGTQNQNRFIPSPKPTDWLFVVVHGVVVHVAVAVMICNLWISVAAKGYQSTSSACQQSYQTEIQKRLQLFAHCIANFVRCPLPAALLLYCSVAFSFWLEFECSDHHKQLPGNVANRRVNILSLLCWH